MHSSLEKDGVFHCVDGVVALKRGRPYQGLSLKSFLQASEPETDSVDKSGVFSQRVVHVLNSCRCSSSSMPFIECKKKSCTIGIVIIVMESNVLYTPIAEKSRE